MKADWGIKFERGQVVMLDKSGVPTRVRILGVTVYDHSPKDPMYEVSEVDTGIRYPAMQSSLKTIPKQVRF
jgi:phage terminase large subunit-like protein